MSDSNNTIVLSEFPTSQEMQEIMEAESENFPQTQQWYISNSSSIPQEDMVKSNEVCPHLEKV